MTCPDGGAISPQNIAGVVEAITPPQARAIRKRALAMTESDRAEYLLGILEQVSWVNPELSHPTDCVKLTRSLRQMLRALYGAMGMTLSKEALLTSVSFEKSCDEIPEIKIVDIHACRIRKALKGHPWELKTDWGVGYRLESVEA